MVKNGCGHNFISIDKPMLAVSNKSGGKELIEVLIPDPTYDNPKLSKVTFLDDLKKDIAVFFKKYKLTETDIGLGADWPMFMVSILGLFFLGKPINENLKAWIELANKFSNFIKKIRERLLAPWVDKRGAILIALQHVIKSHNKSVKSIKLLGVIPILFKIIPQRSSKHLDHHPNALYISAFRVNNDFVYVIGVKSKGMIKFQHIFDESEF